MGDEKQEPFFASALEKITSVSIPGVEQGGRKGTATREKVDAIEAVLKQAAKEAAEAGMAARQKETVILPSPDSLIVNALRARDMSVSNPTNTEQGLIDQHIDKKTAGQVMKLAADAKIQDPMFVVVQEKGKPTEVLVGPSGVMVSDGPSKARAMDLNMRVDVSDSKKTLKLERLPGLAENSGGIIVITNQTKMDSVTIPLEFHKDQGVAIKDLLIRLESREALKNLPPASPDPHAAYRPKPSGVIPDSASGKGNPQQRQEQPQR